MLYKTKFLRIGIEEFESFTVFVREIKGDFFPVGDKALL